VFQNPAALGDASIWLDHRSLTRYKLDIATHLAPFLCRIRQLGFDVAQARIQQPTPMI